MLISLVVPSRPDRVEGLNDSLDAALSQARVDAGVRGDVRLIVEELACNAIEHGGGAGRARELAVDVDIRDDLLHLRFRDSGPPFDPLSAPAPDLDAGIDDRPVGGLGLHLVRQLAEQVRYRREDGHNLLHVTLRIPNEEPRRP